MAAIDFHSEGFRELLTSEGVDALVNLHAHRIAAGANATPSTTNPPHDRPYYTVEEASDGDRARRRVASDGARAAAHEAKTHALLRQL
ncbi:hypothetical protein [Tsukamurella tyrosinosolvens]|uniref:hypothetical protein n=1 Tax=Tsukamurella tyrosinosolvens TaxID=57704 RepID=UPI002DD44063|nr:hypothetical protein [Tsukamurella tyrosinosolvens]MEC4616197.1 hypothetical protein [Tsukamurella tyrosinosolvens]